LSPASFSRARGVEEVRGFVVLHLGIAAAAARCRRRAAECALRFSPRLAAPRLAARLSRLPAPPPARAALVKKR